MKMNRINIIGLIISIVHFITSVMYIRTLPEIVPTHFNMNWVCDGMGSRWTALITAVFPVLSAVFMLFFDKYTKEQNKKPFQIIMFLLDIYLITLNWIILPTMKTGVIIGEKIEMSFVSWMILVSVGFLFVGMGNYLPVVQQNKMLGIRIKWTLENETCWKRTHRFTGKLWVITGLVYIIMLFAFMLTHINAVTGLILCFIVMLIDIIIPMVYAYQHRADA